MRRSLVTIAALFLVLAGCGSGPPQLPLNAAGASRNETAAADMSMRIANFRYELADGVKADKDQQDAYKFASADLDDAKRVAKAFGITASLHSDEYGWTSGSTGENVSDESASTSMYMGKNGMFSVNGSFPVSSGVACAEPDMRDTAVDSVPCETTTTTTNPNLPSESEAKQIASDKLKAAGVDVAGTKVTAEQLDQVVSVRFQPSFEGGLVDGVEHSVTVGPDDVIAYASGFVGDAKSVGSYDLATLQRAVDRLNDTSGHSTMEGDPRSLAADATEPAPDIAPVEDPGTPDQSEPTIVKLTGVRVGLMMTTDDADQSLWLTPAYVFTTDQEGGGSITAPAAHDKYLPPPTTTPPNDGDDPNQVDVPPASDGGSGSTGSGGSTEPGQPENCASASEPIAAQVCTDKTAYKAGEPVVFSITASDEDRVFSDGPCYDGVEVEYGDGDPGEARCLACSSGVAEGAGKMSRSRTHSYAKSGTYEAKFTIKSGADCGQSDPRDSAVTLTLKVHVP